MSPRIIDLDHYKANKGELIAELETAGANYRNRNSILCPFHDDHDPSGSVYRTDNGVWRYKCHACGWNGSVIDVRAKRTGQTAAHVINDLRTDPAPPRANRNATKPSPVFATLDDLRATVDHLAAVYQYTNPTTDNVDLIVLRIEQPNGGKRFLQARQTPGGFAFGAPVKPLPLYNRIRVSKSKNVVVVEGEKKVHALQELGVVATTSPGGAGKAQYADWSPLDGKLTVYLWPDNDAPDRNGKRTGFAHMRDVQKKLEALAIPPRIRWIEVDSLNLPPKGDVVDLLASHAGIDNDAKRELIREVLADSKSVGASQELIGRLNDIGAGRHKAIGCGWPVFDAMTMALQPGKVLILAGDPGATKSYWLLQAAMDWHANGERIAVMMLEEDREYYAQRLLTLRAGDGRIMNTNHVHDNNADVQAIATEHAAYIDGIMRGIHAPDDPMTLDQVADWIEQQAASGARIIAIDPVTMALTGSARYKDDERFMARAKKAIQQFDASLVLITHPSKGRKGPPSLDDIAGGACYSRFAQTVVWIEGHRPSKESLVTAKTQFGTTRDMVEHNRTVHLKKTREGGGGGLQLAYQFDTQTFGLTELGVITGRAEP